MRIGHAVSGNRGTVLPQRNGCRTLLVGGWDWNGNGLPGFPDRNPPAGRRSEPGVLA